MDMRIVHGYDLICETGLGDEIIINHLVFIKQRNTFLQMSKHIHAEWCFSVFAFDNKQMILVFSKSFSKAIQFDRTV